MKSITSSYRTFYILILPLFFALLFLNPDVNFAQSPETKFPGPNHYGLTLIAMDDSGVGFAFGHCGLFMRTTDSGEHWVEEINSLSKILNIRFMSGSNGMVAVIHNTSSIYLTEDGGVTWENIGPSGMNFSQFRQLEFTPGGSIVICSSGGFFCRSDDMGETWNCTDEGLASNLTQIEFYSEDTGVIMKKDGTTFRTTDGGTSWNEVSPTTSNTYNYMKFLDTMVGYRVRSGTVEKTLDGGLSWNDYITGSLITSFGQTIISDDFMVFNNNSAFFYTLDGGDSWTNQPYPNPGPLYFSQHISDSGELWAASKSKTILYSDDLGQNFTLQSDSYAVDMYAIDFKDELNGLAGGHSGAFLVTNDKGETWNSITQGSLQNLSSITHNNNGEYIIGTLEGTIYKTSDLVNFDVVYSGENIIGKLVKNDNGTTLYGVEYYDVLRSTNGGNTWESILTNSSIILTLDAAGDDFVIAGSHNGYLQKSTDSGDNWEDISIQTTSSIRNVDFLNADEGVIVTNKVYTTTNGGESYTEKPLFYNGAATHMFDTQRGIGFGFNTSFGYVYITENGWEDNDQLSISCITLSGSYMADNNDMWFFGPGGELQVLRYNSVDITEASIVDQTLSITPNPATGQAIIQIPDFFSGKYFISVYDHLGNLVLHESHDHRSQIPIFTNGYSEGVYMVQISSGNNFANGKLIIH